MSNRASEWAWNIEGISAHDKLVLVRIAWHANEEGVAYPGKETIARHTCMSKRGVDKAVERLEQSGLIEIRRKNGKGHRHMANEYIVRTDRSAPQNTEQRVHAVQGRGAHHAGLGVHAMQGKGAHHAGLRVHTVQGEGAHGAGGRVHTVQGEGARHAPERSVKGHIEKSKKVHPLAHCTSRRKGKRLSLGQVLDYGYATQAKIKRPDLSQEQIAHSWEKFVSHSINNKIRHESTLNDWLIWIQREHNNVVGFAGRGTAKGSLAEQMATVDPSLYEESLG